VHPGYQASAADSVTRAAARTAIYSISFFKTS
jgi:hypothetical protein